MPRVFTADQLSPISNNPGRVFSAGELEPMDVPKKDVSFTEGLKAGLTAQPGEGVGHLVGAAIPSAVGGAVFGPIGAAVGEAARQTAGAIVNPEATAQKSPLGIGVEVAGAGVMQKAGEMAAPYMAEGAAKVGEGIKGASDWFASRIGKQFLKASKTLNAYGHEPEKALVDEKIFATSWEGLIDRVKAIKHDLGSAYDDIFSTKEPQYVNINSAVTPINSALKAARNYPETNSGVITKLETLKRDVLRRIRKSSIELSEYEVKPSAMPKEWANDINQTFSKEVTIPERGLSKPNVDMSRAKDLSTEVGPGVMETELLSKNRVVTAEEANNIKREIYKLTKYTGNPSDDAALNKTKQYVAGAINKEVEKAVPEIAEVNKRYANLDALEKAAVNRQTVAERNNLVGIPEFAAMGAFFAGGLPAAVATEVTGRVIGTPTGATAAIRGLSNVGKAVVGPNIAKGVKYVIEKTGGAFTAKLIEKGIEKERADHPSIPEEHLPVLVADELKKDPKFYDKGK